MVNGNYHIKKSAFIKAQRYLIGVVFLVFFQAGGFAQDNNICLVQRQDKPETNTGQRYFLADELVFTDGSNVVELSKSEKRWRDKKSKSPRLMLPSMMSVCTPTTSGCGPYITAVTTTGGCIDISNTGTGCSSWTDYYSTKVATYLSTTANISIQVTTFLGSGHFIFCWLTNDNGLTWTNNKAPTSSQGTFTTSFTFATPGVGTYRMRIASNNSSGSNTCTGGNTGEYEDYGLIILSSSVTAGTIGSSQTICNGSSPAVLTSSADGTGGGTISYEWQTNASGSYANISGATANTYQPPALTSSTSYKRLTKLVNACGTYYSAYTTPVTITVNAAVTAGSIGTSQTICNGAIPASLTSTGAGTGTGTITYEWLLNGGGSVLAATAGYSPPALTAASGYTRRTVAVNGVTCYSAYTSPVNISVNAAVTAGSIGSDQTICNGAIPASLTSTGAGTGTGTITYEWLLNGGGGVLAATAGYSPPSLTAASGYTRRTVAVNGVTCYSAYTSPVNISVNAAVTAGSIGTSQTICNGAIPASLTSTGAGTGTGTITYEWLLNGGGSVLATTAGYSPPSLTAASGYTRRTVAVNGVTCYSAYTSPVVITINSLPTSEASADISVCTGTAAIIASGASAGGTYSSLSWAYTPVSGTGSITENVATLTPTFTPTSSSGYGTLTMTVTGSGGCSGTNPTDTRTITWNAIPATPGSITGPVTQCSGLTEQNYSISAVSNTTSYNWQVPAGWTITAGQETVSIAVTTGSPGQNGDITVTAANSCGVSTPKTLTVTVNPNASITSVSGVTPLYATSTTTFSANSVITGGGTGVWSSSDNGVATVNSSGLVTGIAAGTCHIIYTVTGGCGGTISAQQVLTVENKKVNINVMLEGLYNGYKMNQSQNDMGASQFSTGIADEISVALYASDSPYDLVLTISHVRLSTDGLSSFTISPAYSNSYYIVIKHRNSIETWSAHPVSFAGSSVSYNFASSPAQVFGDNLKEVSPGIYAIYGGDSNEDGIIDSGDMADIDYASSVFTFGYVIQDINGDGIVDSSDMAIIDGNSNFFIMLQRPW